MQSVQHLIAAFVLIDTGLHHMGHHRVLPLLEVAAGVLLVVAFIVEVLRHGRGSHSGVGLVEIAGAIMLFVEAINRLFEPHTIAFRIVSFLPPVILLLFALLDVRLARMPQLRATDEAFAMRIRFIRRKSVKWSDVKSARADAETLYVERNDGRITRFKMRELKNRDEAMSWAAEQFRRRGFMAPG